MMQRRLFLALGAAAALAGCNGALDAHLAPFYAAQEPSPAASGASPAASASPGAGSCTNGSATTAATVILISSTIASATSAVGTIAGYANNASASITSATVIDVSVGSTVQFFDGDSGTPHSAAGIPAQAFPTTFAFPAAAQVQEGTTIASSGQWSTGLLAGGCASQVFTVPVAGTYLFGDLSDYGSGMRGAIVAQ